MERLADLLHLVGQAKSAIQNAFGETDSARDLYLEPYDKLERAFSRLNFEAGANQLLTEVDALCLRGLQYGADMLSRLGLSGRIDRDTLVELQQEIESLSAIILDSDLPPEVKDLLSRRVEQLRTAVLEIRLRGAEAVEASLDALFGTVVRAEAPITKSGGKAFLERFTKVLDIGYKLTSMAEKIAMLSGPIVKLIASGHGS